MVRRAPRLPLSRRAASHGVRLPGDATTAMRAILPSVADEVVTVIIAEVPSYDNALSGPMGVNIRSAVQLALGGFLSLASGRRGIDAGTPTAPAVDAAYQLGRGEARSGRTTEALLAAYRIGARVSWRQLSAVAVEHQVPADQLASFAELVFAYIDELSGASVAGHTDELDTTGRVRERLLERISSRLLTGSRPEVLVEAADRAGWKPPATLTAVLVPPSQVRSVLAGVPVGTLPLLEPPGADDRVLLLVPDVQDHRRAALLRTLEGRGALAGPAVPWLEARRSYDRVLRARALGLELDTEAHLPELVLSADESALEDLRTQVLAPLADLRPAAAEKLTETLRSWLLHQGRRDEVAEELFVHAQTVRYRMGQLRELYGDRLDDPDTVLALVLALGARPRPSDASPPDPRDPAAG